MSSRRRGPAGTGGEREGERGREGGSGEGRGERGKGEGLRRLYLAPSTVATRE